MSGGDQDTTSQEEEESKSQAEIEATESQTEMENDMNSLVHGTTCINTDPCTAPQEPQLLVDGKEESESKTEAHGSVCPEGNDPVLEHCPLFLNYHQYAGQSLVMADLLPPPLEPKGCQMLKYWNQRYRLFSKYDQGICMDNGKRWSMKNS